MPESGTSVTADLPPVDGVRHRWVEANGVNLHIAEAGDGPAVLLLHGWPEHWYMWRRVIVALSPQYRVVCVDLRGFGWSDAPATGYAKESMADDVLAVLDAMGIQRASLVGHDLGGWIGYLLCLRVPQRIDRFLALNIVHPWQTPQGILPHLWRFWYQFVLACPLGPWLVRRGGFVRLLLRLGVVDRSVWKGTDDVFVDGLRQRKRALASARLYREFVLHEFLPIIAGRYRDRRLVVPTRVLFGEADLALSPKLLDGYESHADDMRIELVPGCGHFIVDERPELVVQRTLEFLT
jgi:pimeloyl-ACP methyl ester carboxylesterase